MQTAGVLLGSQKPLYLPSKREAEQILYYGRLCPRGKSGRMYAASNAGGWAQSRISQALINPLTIAAKNGVALDMWLRSDLGVLLNTQTSQNAGATFVLGPQLSGASATVKAPIIQTNNVAGGTLTGQARFRYGPDGLNWTEQNVLTATPPIALQGEFKGMQLSFPSAINWAADAQYVCVSSGWPDQTGNGNAVVNLDFTTALFVENSGSYAGIPSLRSGPAAPDPALKRFMVNSTISTLFAGIKQPWGLWSDYQLMNVAAGGMLWNFGYTLQNAKDFHEQQFGGTSQILFNRVDDASLLRQRVTAVGFTDALRHWQQNLFSGTQMTLIQDGAAVSLPGGNADLNVNNVLGTWFTLCCRRGTTSTNFCDARWNELIWTHGVTPAGFNTDMQSYLNLGAARFR